MEVHEVLGLMFQDSMEAAQLADLRVGTVVSTEPLEISINAAMDTLRAGVLYLTAAVVEKKIPVLSHNHSYSDGTTGQALQNLACLENGMALPVENGYIVLNRALEVGDRVLLLRAQGGQKYAVLSRVMEGKNGDLTDK